MFENGYIKLHRSMLSWEWYKDINTTKLFIHLLLKANFEPARFEGHYIPAGSLVTSLQHLANETGLTVRSVRTSLEHLKTTQEVTQYSTPKFTVISIVKWDLYQLDRQSNRQTTDKQVTNNRQTTDNNIRKKERKEEKEIESSNEPKISVYNLSEVVPEDESVVLTESQAAEWEHIHKKPWEGLRNGRD